MDDAIKCYDKAIDIDSNPKAYIGKLFFFSKKNSIKFTNFVAVH